MLKSEDTQIACECTWSAECALIILLASKKYHTTWDGFTTYSDVILVLSLLVNVHVRDQ
jgi:hypothetical protein